MTKMPVVAEGEPVTSGGVSWEVIEEGKGGVNERGTNRS
jgi:hypothetical protein